MMRRLLTLALSAWVAGPAFAASAPPVVYATPAQVLAQQAVPIFGDSFVSSNLDGSGITVPNALAPLWNVPVNNFGIPAQLSTQIAARQSGVAITLTFSGNAITSGGTGNATGPTGTSITAINNVALQGTNTPNSPDYRFLSTASNNNASYQTGTVCGVHGTVRRTASGGPPSTTETYAFIPDLIPGQGSVTCAAQSAWTPDSSLVTGQAQILFGWGRNNYTATAQVESDIAAGVAALTGVSNSRYLVVSITNGDTASEYSGQSNYNSIIAINTNSGSTYGAAGIGLTGHYWDMRAWLISQATGNIVDQANVANDVVPYTLRATTLTGTLNGSIIATGCPVVTATVGALAAGQTIKIDSEYIYALTISGSTVSTCTRGYAGSTAASHTSGVALTGVDYLHLSGSTNQLIANYINTNFKGLLYPQVAYVATPQSLGAFAYRPPVFGAPNIPVAFGGAVSAGGQVSVPYNYYFGGFDSTNVQHTLAGVAQGADQFGNSNATIGCVGTGGTGGAQANCTANKGDWQFKNSLSDLGHTLNAPTTGATVTIADTSDFVALHPAGTLATLTVNLPTCSSTYNGKIAGFSSTQIVTTLTVGATAGSVAVAPTSLAVESVYHFMCDGASTTWYPS